jgi:hypothetical protein
MPDPEEFRNPPSAAKGKTLTPAARRALEEAEARRSARSEPDRPREIAGRDGPDPVRYGDWEVKGIATDF